MEKSNKSIVILRHGQRCDVVHPSLRSEYPNSLDPPLTTLGKHQSQRSQMLISCFFPGTTLKVVTSPFLGCIETALTISQDITIDWRFSDFMHILNYPTSIGENITCHSQWFTDKYFSANIVGNQPNYPEEYQNMKDRVIQAFNEYLNDESSSTLVVVTHLMPLEIISCVIKGEDLKLCDNGFCCVTLGRYNSGKFECLLTADHTHAPQYIKT